MTFPANNPGAAVIGDYSEIAALHGATKNSVDAVTAKLEAMRLLIDTLETLGAAGNALLGTINTAVQDTTAAAVTQSGTWSVNLGTLNGAATEVTLAALSAKTATLGRKVSTGSAPVVLASDHANVPTAPDGVSDAGLTTALAANTALDTLGYGAAILEVTALGGTSPAITVTSTFAGGAAHPLAIINLATNAIVSSITTTGKYQVTAVGQIKYALAGTSPTATVNVLLKR